MRYIKDIPHQDLKIGVYRWNNKYIIKIELGLLEQTYKIEEYEIQDIAELEGCLDEAFLNSVLVKFTEMQRDFQETLHRNNVLF
ncbi:hypothetical protein DYBT9623_01859 [Dyadobacter sp. CECT 9623]|uniref:Uncharacterized protein n=1 Tax=Dyadobacter linearis TaxID=2823330 RepID=A0ABN7R773_9BACT|nr:hypothetical protein DYBT9623_01859 [Dyadobacter sp. CECT 9623]